MDIGKYLVREIDSFNFTTCCHYFNSSYDRYHAVNPLSDTTTCNYFPFQMLSRIADAGTDQETIKLRFRQQKGTALVRWVLVAKTINGSGNG